MRLLQGSLAVEQDSSLTQDILACRKNFCAVTNLNNANGIPNSIEDNSGWIAPQPYSFPICYCALWPFRVDYSLTSHTTNVEIFNLNLRTTDFWGNFHTNFVLYSDFYTEDAVWKPAKEIIFSYFNLFKMWKQGFKLANTKSTKPRRPQ